MTQIEDKLNLEQILIDACSASNLEQVKYLLTSPELTQHADINGWDDEAFICACRTNNPNLIDYMLTSLDLKTHSDVHAFNDLAFIEACNRKDFQLLNYFIFDFKINKTENINQYLIDNKLINISNAFNINAIPLTINDFPKNKILIKKERFYKKNK